MAKGAIRGSILAMAAMLATTMPGMARAADKDMTANSIPPADKARLQVRTLCSCVFVQGRPIGNCLHSKENIYQYLFTDPQSVPSTPDQSFDISVKTDGAILQITDKGQPLAEAQYRKDGGGCVTTPAGTALPPAPPAPAATAAAPAPLPRGPLPAGVDQAWLDQQLANVFTPEGPLRGYSRAIMIVQGGKVVAERYAPGFGPHNLYYSGSIAKIFNNLLAGLLVGDGKLDVHEKLTPPEWKGIKDKRKDITFDDMLYFNSGLGWDEEFFAAGNRGYNVFFAGPESLNSARYVAEQPLEAPPGTHHEYSTGASNLLARELQTRIGPDKTVDRARTLTYLRTKLFEPIGALRVVPEFDSVETLMAGEAVFAPLEDWARIGELYLHDGTWGGKRVLPAGWIKYSTELRPVTDPAYPYGAQLMLKHVAPDCFGHTGVGGSKMIVCPDRDLVMIWMSSDFDLLGYGEYANVGKAYDGLAALQRSIIEKFPKTGVGAAAR